MLRRRNKLGNIKL